MGLITLAYTIIVFQKLRKQYHVFLAHNFHHFAPYIRYLIPSRTVYPDDRTEALRGGLRPYFLVRLMQRTAGLGDVRRVRLYRKAGPLIPARGCALLLALREDDHPGPVRAQLRL